MKRSITLSIFLVFCSGAAAQTSAVIVSTQKQVNPTGVSWFEPAAYGSPIDHRILVVAAHSQVPVATLDATILHPVFYNGPSTYLGDPFTFKDLFVTSDPNGDGRIWVGGLGSLSFTGGGPEIFLTYYELQYGTSWSQNPVYRLTTDLRTHDRPWLAIGPSTANQTVTNFYVMTVSDGTGCPFSVQEKTWIYKTTTPETAGWPGSSVIPVNPVPFEGCASGNCNYRGWASLPVVSNEGDIIVVARDWNSDPNSPAGCYNQRRPYVYWSNNDGQTWLPTGDHPIKLGDGFVKAIGIRTPNNIFSETPFYVDKRACSPAIAIDRQTNTVYVAFAARSDAEPHLDQGGHEEKDWNSDIWIFKGTKDLQTGNWVFNDFVQLTDALLNTHNDLVPDINADGKGPDQFMPAIAVDCAGAINLMFYDNRAETVAPAVTDNLVPRQVDVYYARITGWPDSAPSVYTKRLTPTTISVGPGGEILGDYHTIGVGGSTGQWLYPVYISNDPVLEEGPGIPVRNCYMHSVFIRLCLSDLNMNRAADAGDLDLFWNAYVDGDPMADVTDDGFVNSEDVDEFVDVYSDAIGN